MKSIELTEEQKDVLSVIESAGVEVQYFLSAREMQDLDDYLAHKNAALLTLEKVQKDTDQYFERLLLDEKYKNNKREDFYQIKIEKEKMEGDEITLWEFLGKYYSAERHQAAIRGRSSSFLNSYFWAGEEEIESNVLDINKEFGEQDCGYAYAFLEPPYNIRGSAKEKQQYFHDIERLLFGRFDTDAKIWQWCDNCSNFFDAGKEWWGTYFYTYSLAGSDKILGIIASATD